jgi:hypothetical protein
MAGDYEEATRAIVKFFIVVAVIVVIFAVGLGFLIGRKAGADEPTHRGLTSTGFSEHSGCPQPLAANNL